MENKVVVRQSLGCGGFLLWIAIFGGLKFANILDTPAWFTWLPVWVTLAALVVTAMAGIIGAILGILYD